MNGEAIPEKIKSSLTNVAGIDDVRVFPESGTVLVKSSLPICILQEKIESTGQRAVIKGYGGTDRGN